MTFTEQMQERQRERLERQVAEMPAHLDAALHHLVQAADELGDAIKGMSADSSLHELCREQRRLLNSVAQLIEARAKREGVVLPSDAEMGEPT